MENLVETLPSEDRIPVGNQIEVFTASFNGHPYQEVAVQTKLEVAENAANKGGEYPTLSTFAQSIESLGVAEQLVLAKPPPKTKKSKKSNSSPPETANSTQTGGRGSGRKGGKGTGDGGGGGTGKGEKGGPRRAVDCYFCQSPVARSPGTGECSGPSSCRWAHHFKAFRALLIETNGQLPPGLGDMLKGNSVQKAYRAAKSKFSGRRHHHTPPPSDSDSLSSSESDDGSENDTRSRRSHRSHLDRRCTRHGCFWHQPLRRLRQTQDTSTGEGE